MNTNAEPETIMLRTHKLCV